MQPESPRVLIMCVLLLTRTHWNPGMLRSGIASKLNQQFLLKQRGMEKSKGSQMRTQGLKNSPYENCYLVFMQIGHCRAQDI